MTKRLNALLLLPMGAALLAATAAGDARAQRGAGRVAQALHTAPPPRSGLAPPAVVQAFQAGDPLVDAHGDRAVVPAQYAPGGSFGGPTHGAFGDVGYTIDQVGPHYFDIAVDFVSLRRTEVFDSTVAFSALDFNTDATPPNIVLDSDALTTDYEPGFRLTGRYDVGPMSFVEVGYTGLFDMNMQSSVSASSVNAFGVGNLFSPFTNFGGGFLPESAVDPLEGGFNPNDLENFEETDRASLHSIAFTSDLQTAEVHFRRYWVGHSPRVSGTWLAGFRYTKLQESFRFDSVGNDFTLVNSDPTDPSSPLVTPTAPPVDPNEPPGSGSAAYRIRTDNNLTGFQTGGDVWVGVVQGLRVGAEAKVGIYNNDYEFQEIFTTTDGGLEQFDNFVENNHVAFLTELRLMMVADLLPNLSVRGGYEVLFMNSLALVGDNFNSGSPYEFTTAVPGGGAAIVPPRDPFILDQGNTVFHGFNCGLEFVW